MDLDNPTPLHNSRFKKPLLIIQILANNIADNELVTIQAVYEVTTIAGFYKSPSRPSDGIHLLSKCRKQENSKGH